MHRLLRPPTALAMLAVAVLACGKKDDGPAPPPSATTASPSATTLPPPESPLSVVLESRDRLVLSGLEGGVFVADLGHTRLARAAAGGDLAETPMPPGLPDDGEGSIVRAAGRVAGPVWLVYEKRREDGKAAHRENPLFRLGKEGLKKYADDWKPAIVPWTKHRILAASTSSGRLKIKVIEPSLKVSPDDLPAPRLADAACDKTLVLDEVAALPSGEVFAAGNCRPDVAAGAGASPERYVIIRWGGGREPTDAGPAAARAPAAAAVADAGDVDAGAGPGGDEAVGPPGIVDVIPGASTRLTHGALLARSADDVWAAAWDEKGKASRLFHFDGATWGAIASPAGAAPIRGLASSADGALWMATAHALWRRAAPSAGTWEEVPLPIRATPDAGTAWEIDAVAQDGRDVWIVARATPPLPRSLLLRTRAAPAITRWE